MEKFEAIKSGTSAETLLELHGGITIHNIDVIKVALLEALEGADQLICDLKKVGEIDLAGLQLLCAAHLMALNTGKTFVVEGIKEEFFHSAIVQAGFARHSGCATDIAKTCLWI